MSHALRQGLGGGLRGLRIAGGAVRNLNGEPTKMSAVMYTYVDGMMDKRSPYRSDHLALLTAMTEEGTCLLGGAFAEPCDGAVLLFSDSEQAQTFVDKDPYNTGGLVTSYQIRDYMGVVGTLLKKGASGGGAGEGGGEGSSIPAPDQQASYKSSRL